MKAQIHAVKPATTGNRALTLFTQSTGWHGRECRDKFGMQIRMKERSRKRTGGRKTRRQAQAWGEMCELISRNFGPGQRRLCPCTFLLTPT